MGMRRVGAAEAGEGRVAVEGALDDLASQRLREQLVALLERGCLRLVVDLRHTVTIGSAGIRVLVDTVRSTEKRGGALVVRRPPAGVYELGRARLIAELLALAEDAVEEVEGIHRLDRLFP